MTRAKEHVNKKWKVAFPKRQREQNTKIKQNEVLLEKCVWSVVRCDAMFRQSFFILLRLFRSEQHIKVDKKIKNLLRFLMTLFLHCHTQASDENLFCEKINFATFNRTFNYSQIARECFESLDASEFLRTKACNSLEIWFKHILHQSLSSRRHCDKIIHEKELLMKSRSGLKCWVWKRLKNAFHVGVRMEGKDCGRDCESYN